jgi:hypothetical protein
MPCERGSILTLVSGHDAPNGVSQADAAKMLNVPKRSVQKAVVVLKHGMPELIKAVEQGEIRVSAAAQVATAPVAVQQAAVAAGPKAVQAEAKQIREAKPEPNVTITPMGVAPTTGRPNKISTPTCVACVDTNSSNAGDSPRR